MGLGLGLRREAVEIEDGPSLSGCEERLEEFAEGAKPNAADGREARRLWLVSGRGQMLDPDEREYCEVVFRERPKDAPEGWRREAPEAEKEIPLPVRDWSGEIDIDVAADIVAEVYEKLPSWEPKVDRMRGVEFVRKDWEKMADSTKKEYEKNLRRLDKEICEGKYTDTDILCMLLATAHLRSRSRFFAERSLLQTWAEKNGREDLKKLINSLPAWVDIKKRFGDKPKFVSEKTRERQKSVIPSELLAALSRTLPKEKNQNLAPIFLLLSGARCSELPSVNIFTNPDGSAVIKIENSKLGCARKNAPKFRRIEYAAGSEEARQLSALAEKFGRTPFADVNVATFRSNFRAARKKIEKKNPGVHLPDVHSFRHAFATVERERVAAEMRQLYGECWKADADLREGAQKELSRRLGHQDQRMTAVYGK
ncbi:MAG: hypothetical protein Q4C86_06190 [bacterium]|nr:hypothetical protein [bacterium]